ncbi:helix-turn-helix domain-containing protein [Deinococcus aquaticus]|uniref:helix-turn-helix domain-containing protein n=1 Tax=Deinococcus aquaticus TaxID=328692 RepID=UPI003F45285C
MNYLTPQAAAKQLNVHPKTIIRAAKRGELQSVKIGRTWRVLLPALNTFAPVAALVARDI